MIVLVRIDDRLIHGQVVEGWVNFLKATSLFVADDTVAANPLQRSIMELAAPQGIDVYISRVSEMCDRLRSSVSAAERAILLFSNPGDVVRALKAGLECKSLNVGGMHYTPGKRKLIDILAVNQTDLDALAAIAEAGVRIDVQAVPTQRATPLRKILDACSL
jgi:mannose/fructose/N-acetylgalactosamine-specific phosphotransferase system component IIB